MRLSSSHEQASLGAGFKALPKEKDPRSTDHGVQLGSLEAPIYLAAGTIDRDGLIVAWHSSHDALWRVPSFFPCQRSGLRIRQGDDGARIRYAQTVDLPSNKFARVCAREPVRAFEKALAAHNSGMRIARGGCT